MRDTAQQAHPSGVAASLPVVRVKRAGWARNARPYGVAAIPLHIATAGGWQPFCGTTPLRAKRVLKGKWVIDKREETAGCLPLARSAAAHTRRSGRPASNRRAAAALSESEAAIPPAMRGHFRCAFQGEYERARARSFASLRMTKKGGFPRLRERAPAAPRRCSPLQ